MLDQQHFLDLGHENGDLDPRSWLSEQHHHSSSHPISSNAPPNDGNVDRVLFKNLVEMVPLVESLMDRRANASFTRRASLIYTRTPARESHHKKILDGKGRKTQTVPTKKRVGGNDHSRSNNRDSSRDDHSMLSSKALVTEKDEDELVMLRERVEDLQKKLLEKDELLKSAETSINQMNQVHKKLEDLKRQLAEKDATDALIKSANLQLSDAKIKLADKQAALEKLQWEVVNANCKAANLQEDVDSMEGETAQIIGVIEALAGTDPTAYDDDKKNMNLDYFDQLSLVEEEEVDDIDMQQMEEARQTYLAAVAYAKENPSEKTLAMAAEARLRLQSFVFGSNSPKRLPEVHQERINAIDESNRSHLFSSQMLVQ
ncbi:protein MICROTUBULE BINDING PROTEIN 2C-like isoform X2 [Aristolochia californica]|uniref:protein MICROTUBULE BINDING PROTEIN 2C-like isoform X2 n=1 Tax=Aristolochia californica TaxID=171875 RepID=UPI0035DAB7BA